MYIDIYENLNPRLRVELRLLGLFIILSSSSCEDIPVIRERIHVVNNSSHNIESSAPLRNGPFYPDTSLITVVQGSIQETTPGSKAYFDFHGRGSISEYLEASPQGLVSIYIFHPDTLAAYTNTDVIEGYKVLARYDLSLANIETLDFFVPYPPSEAMDSMQVYIP